MRLPVAIVGERFPWWIYWVTLALIVLIALAPLVVSFYAAGLAASYGCTLSQDAVIPCLVDGVDRGPWLHELGLGYWYMMLTFPAFVMMLGLWAIALIVHRRAWRRPIIGDPT